MRNMWCFVGIAVLGMCTAATHDGSARSADTLSSCTDPEEQISCMKASLFMDLENIIHKRTSRLNDLVTIEQKQDVAEASTGRALSINDLDSKLSANPEEKNYQLDTLIMDRVGKLFKFFAAKIDLNNYVQGASVDIARGRGNGFSLSFDLNMPEDTVMGRGKEGKNILPLLLALKMKFATLAKIALVGLAFIAFKAILISKLSIVLSVIYFLKKLSHNHHGHEHGGRSSDNEERVSEDAHDMAYSAYRS